MSNQSVQFIDQHALTEWSKRQSVSFTQKLWGPRLVVRADQKGTQHLYYDRLEIRERILAYCGYGGASFKSIASFCLEKHLVTKGFHNKVVTYNASHLFFKQIGTKIVCSLEHLEKDTTTITQKELANAIKNDNFDLLKLWQTKLYKVTDEQAEDNKSEDNDNSKDGQLPPLEHICAKNQITQEEIAAVCKLIEILPGDHLHKSKEAFWHACFNKHNQIIKACIQRSLPLDLIALNIATNQRGNNGLSCELEADIVRQILLNSDDIANFEALSKTPLPSLEALKVTLLLNKKIPDPFKYRLNEINLSDDACKALVARLPENIQEEYKKFAALQGPIFSRKEAILAAIINIYTIPKIQRVANQAFLFTQIKGIRGWKILTENTTLYLITSRTLGKGASKKAVTAVQMNLQNNSLQLVVNIQWLAESDLEKKLFRRELKIWKEFKDSPYFVKLLFVHPDLQAPDALKIGTIAEACDGGNCDPFTTIKQHPLKVRLKLFDDILHAICEMHKKKITHGDLKLENAFVKYEDKIPRAKISDFGNSFRNEQASYSFKKKKLYGSPDHTSPELRYADPAAKLATLNIDFLKTDIWALGIMLKHLYDGYDFSWMQDYEEEPYTVTAEQLKTKLKEEIEVPLIELSKKQNLNQEDIQKAHIFALLHDLMQFDPNLRISAEEAEKRMPALLSAKQLPQNWNSLLAKISQPAEQLLNV